MHQHWIVLLLDSGDAVASRGDSADQDLKHPVGKPTILAHGLVGRDLDLSRLSISSVIALQSGLLDPE